MKDLNLDGFELINIKEESILPADIDFAAKQLGGVQEIFSKRAMKYREWGLHEKNLTEQEMKELILKEYTFLKRPLAIVGEQVFSGSAKSVTESLKAAING